MKLNCYSIFDTASGLYSRPFYGQSDGEAIRSFMDISTDAEHPIGKHPDDYTLLRIGIFDDTDGKLTDELNSSLLTGLEAVARSRKVDPEQRDLLEKEISGNGQNQLEVK